MKNFLKKYKYILLILLIISPVIIGERIYYYFGKKHIINEYNSETIKILNLKEDALFLKFSENKQKLNSAKRFINLMIERDLKIIEDSGKMMKINAENLNQSYNKLFVLPVYKLRNSSFKSIREFLEQELYVQNVFAEFWQKSGNNFVRTATNKKSESETPVFITADDLPAKEILKGNEYINKNISENNLMFSLSFPIYKDGKILYFITLKNNENILSSLNNNFYKEYGTDFIVDKKGKVLYGKENNINIPDEINPAILNIAKIQKQSVFRYVDEDIFLKYIPEFDMYLGIFPNNQRVKQKISDLAKRTNLLTLILSLIFVSVFLLFDYYNRKRYKNILKTFSEIFPESDLKFNKVSEVHGFIKEYYDEVGSHIQKMVSGEHNLQFNDKFKSLKLISYIEQINNKFIQIKETEASREETYKTEEKLNKTRFEISEILQYAQNIEEVSYKIIKKIAEFTSSEQIAFFVSDEDFQKKKSLKMTASYAWSKERSAKKVLDIGEGLIGRVYLEKKTVFLTEIPDNYTFIESGFGFQKPNCLLIIPLIFNNEVQAVIELGSIKIIEDYKIKFLEDVGETVASAVANLKHSKQTEILLKQTTEQSKEIEEQRKTLEEKINTHRKQNRNLDKQILQLIEIIDSIKSVSYLIEYDTKGNIVDVSNRMINLFDAEKRDFIAHSHKDIIVEDNYDKKYQQFWELLGKNKTQYVTEVLKINNREVKIKQTYVPIKNVRRKIYRILSIGSILD